MEQDGVGQSAADGDVMAAVEDGPVKRLVLADVSQDEAYVTAPLEETVSLVAWR